MKRGRTFRKLIREVLTSLVARKVAFSSLRALSVSLSLSRSEARMTDECKLDEGCMNGRRRRIFATVVSREGEDRSEEKGGVERDSLRVRLIRRGFSRLSARVRARACGGGLAKTESRRKLDYCRIVAGSKR